MSYGDNVVFLAYRNASTAAEEQRKTFIACIACRNKTYTLMQIDEGFPMLECTACGIRIGRIGWAPSDDKDD